MTIGVIFHDMLSVFSSDVRVSGPANKILRIRKRKTKARPFVPRSYPVAEAPAKIPLMEIQSEDIPIIIDMFTRTDPEESVKKVKVGEDGSLNISLLRY